MDEVCEEIYPAIQHFSVEARATLGVLCDLQPPEGEHAPTSEAVSTAVKLFNAADAASVLVNLIFLIFK